MSRGTRDVKTLVSAQRVVVAAVPADTGGTVTVAQGRTKNEEADMLVGILKDKLLKQKEELDTRTDSINAIQRNFERLSQLYDGEKSEFTKLREKFVEAMKEIDALHAELKLNGIVRKEYDRLKLDFQALLKHSSEAQAVLVCGYFECSAYQRVELAHELELAKAQNAFGSLRHLEVEGKLKAEVDSLRGENQRLCEAVAEESVKFRNSQQNLAYLEAKIQSLESQLAASKREFGDTQGSLLEQQSSLTQAHATIASLKEQIRVLQQNNGKLEEQAGAKDKALSELKKYWGAEQAKWEAEKASTQELVERLRKELEATQSDFELKLKLKEDCLKTNQLQFDAEVKKFQGREAELQQQNESLLLQTQQLTQEISTLREKLSQRCSELESDRHHQQASLRQSSQQLLALRSEVAALQRQLGAAEADRHNLKSQLAELQSRVHASSSQGQLEKARVERLETSVLAYLEEHLATTGEVLACEVKHALYASTLASTHEFQRQSEITTFIQEIKELSWSQVREVGKVVDGLRKEVAHLTSQHAVTRTTLEHQIFELKESYHKSHIQIEDLTEETSELKAKVQSLESALTNSRSELAFAKQKTREDSETISSLKALQSEKDTRLEDGLRKLKALQQGTLVAVRKLVAAEEASESGYTCLSCMNIFSKPAICVPCGHTFCSSCVASFPSKARSGHPCQHCPECHEYTVEAVIPSETLEMLSGKFTFRKQVLKDLATEVMQKT